MGDNYFDRYEAALKEEKRQLKLIKATAIKIAQNCSHIWNFGNGDGGYVIELIREEVYKVIGNKSPAASIKIKNKISNKIRKFVYERDAYRCVTCNSHTNLSLDHITPESKGGATTIENLQTMCMPCNLRKGVN